MRNGREEGWTELTIKALGEVIIPVSTALALQTVWEKFGLRTLEMKSKTYIYDAFSEHGGLKAAGLYLSLFVILSEESMSLVWWSLKVEIARDLQSTLFNADAKTHQHGYIPIPLRPSRNFLGCPNNWFCNIHSA
jgi:hypothetical protein